MSLKKPAAFPEEIFRPPSSCLQKRQKYLKSGIDIADGYCFFYNRKFTTIHRDFGARPIKPVAQGCKPEAPDGKTEAGGCKTEAPDGKAEAGGCKTEAPDGKAEA